MLNRRVLDTEIQDFIKEKSATTTSISAFVLSKNPFSGITIQELATQINGRQKALKKFPIWALTPQCYYPPNSNLEQTSSEITARYKSTLTNGNSLIDLTGGFGIDTYYFSLKMREVFHCEINPALGAIAAHNFKQLEATNIKSISGDGLEVLRNQQHLDWIYIDPSRRSATNSRVFFLEDCLPNVPKHLDLLFEKSANILIKTAPLLDLQSGCKSLKYVKEIHIVAIKNDVKEILWVLVYEYAQGPLVKTANFTHTQVEEFQFLLKDEAIAQARLSMPLDYLYEPNAAILKSGAFSTVAHQLDIEKLHSNTHLYTSSIRKHDFPGRTFKILKSIPYSKKAIKQLGITKANITTRNFPETVATLRKKFGIKEGGATYIFFTTTMDQQKMVLLCKKTS